MDQIKGKKRTMEELGRLSVEAYQQVQKRPIVIVLDDIRSLHNVGSVFRTSDAFSVQKIILCGITARPPHREIQKTALGATESVEWEYAENCLDVVKALQAGGYSVYGVEQVAGSYNLSELGDKLEQPLALVFGNEVKGVSQPVLDQCDGFIEIPQSGTKHSLNVSVSVGVVLWELIRNNS